MEKPACGALILNRSIKPISFTDYQMLPLFAHQKTAKL
jgi:hypothetical protein